MKHSIKLRKFCVWSALAVLLAAFHSVLAAQDSAAQPSEKPAAKKVQAPAVDREAIRKEAKKRREAERKFDETTAPANPFIKQNFPSDF